MPIEKTTKLETRQLSYIYSHGMAFEKTALCDVNISIDDGEFVGLIGHTGSGKSTLAQLFAGLLTPSHGSIYLDGEDIFKDKKKRKDINRKVGLIFQYPEHQLFEVTVYNDVAFGPKNMGLSEEEVRERVCNALELVGIPENMYEKSPFELSGGQKRRVAIAGVLSMNPEILILDEPTAGLDPRGKKELLEEIEGLKGSRTIILISHIMDDIARLSDKIITLENGSIASIGAPEEIFSESAFLERLGLSVTKSTELLLKLKERGFDVDVCKFTPEAVADEILRVVGKGRAYD